MNSLSKWSEKSFEECLGKVEYTFKVQRKDFLQEGKYPVVSQESDFINGYWNKKDDVFEIGQTPIVLFGDHTKVIKYIDFDFVLGADGVKILKPKEFIIPKYLFYKLHSVNLDSLGYARHYKLLRDITVRYPSTKEQRRIVSVLDKVFADIAKAKENAEKNLQNARELFESYLQNIFAIARDGWEEKKLMDACTKITDGSHFSPDSTDKGPYPYITVRDIDNDKIDFEGCRFIDKNNYQLLLKNGCQPICGDVLFSKDGTVGKVSLVDCNKDFVVLSSLAIIRPNQKILVPSLLKYILKNPAFLKEAIGRKTGVAIKRIILKNLKLIDIRYPQSIKKQQEIAANLVKLSAETNKLEAMYKEKLSNLEELKKSILQKAFNGELPGAN